MNDGWDTAPRGTGKAGRQAREWVKRNKKAVDGSRCLCGYGTRSWSVQLLPASAVVAVGSWAIACLTPSAPSLLGLPAGGGGGVAVMPPSSSQLGPCKSS
jgi:hypothetical protein